MSLASILFCANAKHNDNKRDAGLTTPENIIRFDNISYGPHGKWNLLDVYRPKAAPRNLPVLVSVHGGGWVYGDKELYQYYCMSLAQQGFAVVNYTYRLAPKYKFPAALEDTNNVFQWVLNHTEQYGFDTEHVFAVGDSAGAHNLGLYCCICADPAYAKTYPFSPPAGFLPTAVALNCGVYQIKKEKKRSLTSQLMADLLPEKGSEAELKQISVMDHLTPAFPPCFLMTCEGDFLAEAAPPMADALRALGVQTEYRYYGDPEHVLGHVFHCNMRLPEAQQCNRDECDWFKTLILLTDKTI